MELDKLIPQFMWKNKHARIFRKSDILGVYKKNNEGSLTLPDTIPC